jgi:hypothetical protein
MDVLLLPYGLPISQKAIIIVIKNLISPMKGMHFIIKLKIIEKYQ